MKSYAKFHWVCGVVVVFFVVAAAGWASGTQQKSQPGGAGNSPVTLSLQSSFVGTAKADAVMESYIKAYESDHPNVKIDYSDIPWNQLHASIMAKAASNTLPGIMYDSDAWGEPQFQSMGLFVDLNKYMTPAFRAKFTPSEFAPYAGKALPADISFETPIFYRPKVFAQNGIAPPAADKAWTWQQFLTASQKMTQDTNGNGKINQWGYSERGLTGPIFSKALIPYEMSYGTDIIVKKNGHWTANLNDPTARAALEREISLSTKYHVIPPDFLSWNYSIAKKVWNSHKVAMMEIGAWFAPAVQGKFGSDYNIMLFPTDKKPSTLVTMDWWNITKDCQNPAAAFKFLEYLYQPAHLRALSQANNNVIPATLDAQKGSSYNETNDPMFATRLAKWLSYERSATPYPGYYEIWNNDVDPFVQAAIQGQMSAKTALDKAQAQIQHSLQNQ